MEIPRGIKTSHSAGFPQSGIIFLLLALSFLESFLSVLVHVFNRQQTSTTSTVYEMISKQFESIKIAGIPVHTTEDTRTLPAILYTTANICNPVLSKRCLISWCRKVAVEIGCTFQQSSAKRRPHTRWLGLVLNTSPTLKRCPAVPAILNRSRTTPQSIMRDLERVEKGEREIVGWPQEDTQAAKKSIYRKMIGSQPRWKAFSCGQTCPRAFPRWFHRLPLRRGKSFRRQSWDISCRTPDSTRCSTCYRDRRSCWTPTHGIVSSSAYSRLNNCPAMSRGNTKSRHYGEPQIESNRIIYIDLTGR